MSCNHPTHGPRTVPFDFPVEQIAILRSDLFGALAGALRDLTRPGDLRDPAAVAGDGAVYVRLLEALDHGEIALPDEEGREGLERLVAGFDEAAGYRSIAATHDAHWALIEVLGGVEAGCPR